MRWTVWIAVVLLVVLSAYAVWPVVGFYKIASAVESRDTAALTQRVDFRSLRKALTKQLIATYLELTRKKLGLIEKSIAVGVGGSIADPIVARLVNAETLLDLLTKGNAGEYASVFFPRLRCAMVGKLGGIRSIEGAIFTCICPQKSHQTNSLE